MIKAVLTDLDGVVRKWDFEIIQQAETAAGLPCDALPSTAFEPDLLVRAITGRISDASWRTEVAERLQLRFPDADAAEAVRLWSLSPGEIDTDVLELLQRCRVCASLVLITNATTRLESDLKRLGISRTFDHIVNSSSIGHAKPHPGIFNAALNRLSIKAHEALFVDDKAENVYAAAELGINGYQFTTVESLKTTLAKHGLSG